MLTRLTVFTSDMYLVKENYYDNMAQGFLSRDHDDWCASNQAIHQLVKRTKANIVFGHDNDVSFISHVCNGRLQVPRQYHNIILRLNTIVEREVILSHEMLMAGFTVYGNLREYHVGSKLLSFTHILCCTNA